MPSVGRTHGFCAQIAGTPVKDSMNFSRKLSEIYVHAPGLNLRKLELLLKSYRQTEQKDVTCPFFFMRKHR
jgi:hypothetical protein